MRIAGSSMSPTLNTDDYVIAIRQPKWWPKKRGQIYLFDHPSMGWMVKRFERIVLDSFLTFKGDNIFSISTESIGLIDGNQLIYRVMTIVKSTH